MQARQSAPPLRQSSFRSDLSSLIERRCGNGSCFRLTHLMPRHDLLDRSLVDEFHAAGKQVFAWTVNRERRMRTLTEIGVDGLISDEPALLARFRESFER